MRKRWLLLLAAPCGVALVSSACAGLAGLEEATAYDAGADVRVHAEFVSMPEEISVSAHCLNIDQETTSFTIENRHIFEAPLEILVPDGLPLAVRDSDGKPTTTFRSTIPPKTVFTVFVHPTTKKPGPFSGSLSVRAGERFTPIRINGGVRGPELTFAPTVFDFGRVSNAIPSEQVLQISNVGTEPITLTQIKPTSGNVGDFKAGSGSKLILPGVPETATITFPAGDAGPLLEAAFTPETDQAACSPPPALTLRGQRVVFDVTASPVKLNFGDQDCRSLASGVPQVITVKNGSSSEGATYDVLPPANTTWNDSWFSVDKTQGSVAAGAESKVNVSLKPLGAILGEHTEVITVRITSPVEARTDFLIGATVKVVGAKLSISPTSLAFDSSGGGRDRKFIVTNSGNKAISLRTILSNPSAFGYQAFYGSGDDDFSLGSQGATRDIDLRFTSSTVGTHTGTATLERKEVAGNAKLCDDTPLVVNLTGVQN